jgi:hypothetical protein
LRASGDAKRLLDLFQAQLQLIGIERLRSASVLRTQQLLDHQPQLVDLSSGRVALDAQAVALRP